MNDHLDVLRLFGFSALVAAATSLAPACGGDTAFTEAPAPSGDDCSANSRTCAVLCDASLGCVDCLSDDDCGVAAPRCIAGQCEECAVAADCAPGESCFPRDHQCRDACGNNGDCGGNEPLCDTDTGACVGCVDANDCDANEVCNPATQQCTPCASSADCPVAEPYCDAAGRCRNCLVDGHCGAGEVCADHHCQNGCQSNDDCSNENPICNNGDCVECTSGDHCGAATPLCRQNRCVECENNGDCGEARPFCDGDGNRCVECTNDDQCAQNEQCNNNECRPN